MLCRQNTCIFLKILEILLMLCKIFTEHSEKIGGGDCNTPRTSPSYIAEL
jgi:hypothetical protein